MKQLKKLILQQVTLVLNDSEEERKPHSRFDLSVQAGLCPPYQLVV